MRQLIIFPAAKGTPDTIFLTCSLQCKKKMLSPVFLSSFNILINAIIKQKVRRLLFISTYIYEFLSYKIYMNFSHEGFIR